METVKVIALKQHEYGHKPRKKGERYDMEVQFVAVMEHVGNVRREEESDRGRYQRRDLRAES